MTRFKVLAQQPIQRRTQRFIIVGARPDDGFDAETKVFLSDGELDGSNDDGRIRIGGTGPPAYLCEYFGCNARRGGFAISLHLYYDSPSVGRDYGVRSA